MNKLNTRIAAVAGAVALVVAVAPHASAYTGDYFLNCGIGAGVTGYTGRCDSAGYSITYKTPDGFQHDDPPGYISLNNVWMFYTPSCFKIRNLNTGYDYLAGWHVMSAPNLHLTLQRYYQGWC